MKRRSPDDPVRKDIERFANACKNLFIVICEMLHIDRFVEWLNKKLK